MNSGVRIDHLIFGSSMDLAKLLALYAELGFRVSPFENTVRHDPGLRTGFLYFSPLGFMDYIEFITVEVRELFDAAQGKHGNMVFSEDPYAQGVGIRAQSVQSVFEELKKQGTAVKPVWSKAPEDQGKEAPPRWSFVELENPAANLGGFYVEYLKPRAEVEPSVFHGGNGIFAMGGLLYNDNDSEKIESLLRKDFPQSSVRRTNKELWLGCHRILPRPFQEIAALAGKDLKKHPTVEVYGALFYTENLNQTEAALKGKWKPYIRSGDEIYLLPSENEGLLALVIEKPIEKWKQERDFENWLF